MKKYYINAIIILVILVILVIVLLKNMFILLIMYKNNTFLDKDTNRQIKSLVINAIKDRCSLLHNIDDTKIYTLDSADIIQYDVTAKFKSPICYFNYDFMDSVYQEDNSTYHVVVKMKFPEENFYNFIISKHDYTYSIDFFQLDV